MIPTELALVLIGVAAVVAYTIGGLIEERRRHGHAQEQEAIIDQLQGRVDSLCEALRKHHRSVEDHADDSIAVVHRPEGVKLSPHEVTAWQDVVDHLDPTPRQRKGGAR